MRHLLLTETWQMDFTDYYNWAVCSCNTLRYLLLKDATWVKSIIIVITDKLQRLFESQMNKWVLETGLETVISVKVARWCMKAKKSLTFDQKRPESLTFPPHFNAHGASQLDLMLTWTRVKLFNLQSFLDLKNASVVSVFASFGPLCIMWRIITPSASRPGAFPRGLI